jgi:hypothetical protein
MPSPVPLPLCVGPYERTNKDCKRVFARTSMRLGSHAMDLLGKLRLKDKLQFEVRVPCAELSCV